MKVRTWVIFDEQILCHFRMKSFASVFLSRVPCPYSAFLLPFADKSIFWETFLLISTRPLFLPHILSSVLHYVSCLSTLRSTFSFFLAISPSSFLFPLSGILLARFWYSRSLMLTSGDPPFHPLPSQLTALYNATALFSLPQSPLISSRLCL